MLRLMMAGAVLAFPVALMAQTTSGTMNSGTTMSADNSAMMAKAGTTHKSMKKSARPMKHKAMNSHDMSSAKAKSGMGTTGSDASTGGMSTPQ